MEKQAWTIGESVVVKPGVSDLFEEEGTVMIHWDRLTLERMPLAHIAWCEEECLDWSAMTLAAEEVVPATARETEEEVVQACRTIESQTNWSYLGGEQGQRVQALVNRAEDKDDDDSMMQTWHTHLTKHLTCPFTATVTEEQRGPTRRQCCRLLQYLQRNLMVVLFQGKEEVARIIDCQIREVGKAGANSFCSRLVEKAILLQWL